MKENKSYFKSQKGITLVALIITIILMFVLARITVSATIGPDGIIARARKSAHDAEIKEMYELIGTHYESLKLSDEIIGMTEKEIFQKFREKLSSEVDGVKNEYIFENNYCMVIKTEDTGYFTVLEDGTVYEGITNLWLDIADGNIILKENSFLQTTDSIYRTDDLSQSRWFSNDIVKNKENVTLRIENEIINSYIISGKSYKDENKELNGEYVVLVYGKGNYDIKIKDLEITGSTDSRGANGTSIPFMANGMVEEKGVYVNLILEGENKLIGGSGACGLAFTGGKPNINGETEGSTLTISGKGSLYAKGANLCPGIGTGYGYPPWMNAGSNAYTNEVNNIIINSGNITAEAGGAAPAIGSEHSAQLDKKANNIIINGGIINTKSSLAGIGAKGVMGRVEINGGILNALKGEAIGHTSDGLGELVITGGIINDLNKNSIIGEDFGTIIIEGGTINCKKIGNENTNKIQILGGSIIMDSETGIFNKLPTNGKENVYLTQLSGMPKDSKIDSLEITGLSYEYGSKDLQTDEEGNLYLYLPQGERDITVTIRGVTYPFNNTVTN